MQLIRGLHNLTEQNRGCALTIGNFDGLHLGHQALLEMLADAARKNNTKRCLMTFEPLPHEFFSSPQETSRLMNTREKLIALSNCTPRLCPDYMLLLNFNSRLSEMTAKDFIEKILVNALKIKSLIIGDDFKFGRGRKGDLEMLQTFGAEHHFDVASLSTHHIDDTRVSSSRIRDALSTDQLQNAEAMLGRPYQICGRIAHGDKRGRSIGFPTANIQLHRPATPLHGVYSVTMHSGKFGNLSGIANIGRRPTVGGDRIQLEVHLFDFKEDMYGQNVCVSFQQKIRNEKKFESLENLKQQIEIDCKQARKNLALKI
jgi:riboflavin kinase/FMN adenylyltransferase